MAEAQEKDTVQGAQDFFTNTTEYNRLCFVVKQIMSQILNTADLVRIDGVTGGGADSPPGTVAATPLVAQTDAKGNALPMASIPRMPFFRYQAGIAAFIVDPVPGDQAVAVYCKADPSGIADGQTEPQVPSTFRSFDQANGMVFGGVQNKAPEVWIQIKQDKTIVIHAPAGCTIETDKAVSVNAGTKITLTAPSIELNGAITSHGTNGGSGTMDINGTLTVDGINMNTHTHTGAHGETSGPH